jgi:hypothetical protein
MFIKSILKILIGSHKKCYIFIIWSDFYQVDYKKTSKFYFVQIITRLTFFTSTLTARLIQKNCATIVKFKSFLKKTFVNKASHNKKYLGHWIRRVVKLWVKQVKWTIIWNEFSNNISISYVQKNNISISYEHHIVPPHLCNYLLDHELPVLSIHPSLSLV